MKSIKFLSIFFATAVFVMIFSSLQAQVPQITQQPSNIVKCVGNSVSITLVATGSTPLSYQWYKDGTPYGGNSSILDFLSLTETDEGVYYCNVSNGEGNVDSYSFTIAVANGIPTINSITTDNDLVCIGTSNLFESDITGENFSLTWYRDVNIVDFGDDYLLENATLADEGNYYFIVSNVCGEATSASKFIDIVSPAHITTQPTTQTICEGENAIFSAISGGDYLYYIWMENDALMPTEQTSELTISGATFPHNSYYNLIAYNVCNHDTSNTVLITVNNLPQITGQPIDHTVCLSEETTLYANAGGTSLVSYQWYELETGIIANEILDSFEPPMVSGDTSYYYCQMSNLCGIVNSDTAQVIGKEAPVISQQPIGTTVCAGQNVTLQIKATGTETLFFQWLFNGADANGSNMSGIETNTLTITNITAGQQGIYTCHVVNDCGFAISNEAEVIVNIAPIVTEQPEDIVICEGEEMTINISSDGTEPVIFEWYIIGSTEIIGSDQDYFTDYANPENSGEYYCVLSNSCGEISTDTINVEIRALPVITTHPIGDEVCVGDLIEMEIVATGAEPLDYLWYRNGSALSGQTNSVINYAEAQVNNSGEYFCRVINNCGFEDSNTAMIIVSSPPAITWNPIDQTLCELETLNLIMDAQGDNYQLQWYFNNIPIPGMNDTVLNLTNIDVTYSGLFYCTASNICAIAYTDTVEVVVHPAPEIDLGDDINLCTGDVVTIGPEDIYVHYEWNTGLSFQPNLEVHLGGTFILEVTGNNSCHNRDTLIVTYHPYHQILFSNENIVVCGEYVLNAGDGAYSYLWNNSQIGSSITVTSPGTYSVTTTGDSFGCESTQSVYIDLRQPISFNLGPDLTAPVDSFVNVGIAPIFSEYLWNTGFTGPTLTVYGSTYGPGQHQFWLTAIATNGCNYTDTINVSFYNNSGIEQNNNNSGITVFPNPASDFITISSEDTLINGVEIYNVSGKLVYKEMNNNNIELSINVSNFAKGLYLIKIVNADNDLVIRKILIQ